MITNSSDGVYGFKDDAVKVADKLNDYTYDANGNLTSDTNKGITNIHYNHLNLPTTIVFNNDPNQKISYMYTADGVKLQKIVNDHGSITTTDYAGDYIYENGTLKFINHAEGYLQPNGAGGFEYVYQYKDHLGNVRLSYSDTNGDGVVDVNEIIEENNYYPFGLKHKGYNSQVTGTHHNWDFQGQEYTEDFGLNIHEWKYRISDPAIGRFWQVDPLAEDYVHNGVYNFSENRVIDAYELEGAEAVVISEEGQYSKLNVGHTFVTVGSGENMVAYTYGRYAELVKDKSSLNSTNLEGQGVLIRLEGQDAVDMVDRYVNDFGAEAFEITTADESEVAQFFEDQFNASDEIPTTGKYKGDDRARVVDMYDLANNNCTTKSCQGIENSTGQISYEGFVTVPRGTGTQVTKKVDAITPAGIVTQLNEASKDPNSGVINVTDRYKKQE